MLVRLLPSVVKAFAGAQGRVGGLSPQLRLRGSNDVLLIPIAFEAACSGCSDASNAIYGDNPLMAYQPPKRFTIRRSDIPPDVLWT